MKLARAALPVLAIAGAVAVLCGDRLLDPGYPPPTALDTGADLVGYFYPAAVYLRAAFMRGELPLWNPHQMAGEPFLATHQPAAAYPLMLVFVWLQPRLALAAHGLVHVFLAGALTYAYARRIRLEQSAALAAAFAYMLSLAVLIALFNSAYLATYVWLPAVLWGVYEIADARSAKGVFLLALAAAMSLLAGHAQACFYTAEVAAGYAGLLLLTRAGKARIAALLVLGVAIAAGIGAAQLVMAAELGASGVRSFGGLPIEQAGVGFSLAMLLDGLAGGETTPGLNWANISMLTIPLAVAALLVRRTRAHAAFFLALGVVLFDFMRGTEGVTFAIQYRLPLGDVFRLPGRATFVYTFAAAMLVGLGTSSLHELLRSHRRAAAALASLIAVGVAVELYVRNEVPVRYLPLTTPELLEAPADVVAFARERAQLDRVFVERDIPGLVPYKLGQMYGVFALPDYEPLLPAAYHRFFERPADRLWHGYLNVTPEPYENDDRARTELQPIAPSQLDLLSVRYYVDDRRGLRLRSGSLAQLLGASYVPTEATQILERPAALPRAYVVHEVLRETDPEAALAKMRAHDFDPRRQAVIDTTAEGPEPEVKDAWEYARILEYAAQTIDVEVRCASRCLAVLTDLYYPGWEASVDGRPAEILRTNFLVRGVIVAPGVHRVRFRYLPARFLVGAGISVLSAVVLLLIGLRAIRERDIGGRPIGAR